MPSTRQTQESRVLMLLQATWPGWVPAPALAKISLQYSARIFSLRRRGWLIENRVQTRDGVRHGSFRLGSGSVTKPVPKQYESPSEQQCKSNAKADAKAMQEHPAEASLFGNIARDRTYAE